jgi:hypothetical protein
MPGISHVFVEIQRFVSNPASEVLCITGKWGVGKTFAWNQNLQRAKDTVELARYSYVSLFGLSSLDELRTAIFANTVPRDAIGQKPDLSTFKDSFGTVLEFWRSVINWVKFAPGLGNLSSVASKIGFLSIRNQIVCIDDLERAGKSLRTIDALGVASFLKEQRDCKVVFLLNDEALEGDEQKDFRAQLEKVADTVLRFEPTPEESAEIGVDASGYASSTLES